MLAQIKLQLHFYSLGINNQLKDVRKKIIELAAASVSCLSQLLCCPLLLVHGFVVNWKVVQLPPAHTHTEFTRGSSSSSGERKTRTEFLNSRSARPLVLVVVQSGGCPHSGNKWQQSLIHSEATWLQRFHQGRWRDDHDPGQSGSPQARKRSVVWRGLEDRVRWRKWKHSFRGRERVRFHTCTNYENSHRPNVGKVGRNMERTDSFSLVYSAVKEF